MVLMTMIARVSDGLPLAASVQDDEMVSSTVTIVFQLPDQTLFLTAGQKLP